MSNNSLTKAAQRGRTPANPYGVPTLYRAARPAGDAIDDLIARMAAESGSGSSNSGSTLSDADLADIARGAGLTPDVPPGELTDRQRERIATQNAAIINMATRAIGETGETIRAAITSGNQVEIERIRGRAQVAAAEAIAQIRIATSAGDAAARAEAQQRLEAAAAAAHLLQLQLTAAPSGVSTKTLLLVGGGVALVAGAYYLATRPKARRNPVMVRDGRKRFVNAKKAARARRLGWRKAR